MAPLKEDLKKFLLENRAYVPEHALKRFLGTRGLEAPRGYFIKKGKKAPAAPKTIRFPVAAKIVPAGIKSGGAIAPLGKSDIGGVRLGIHNISELKKNISELMLIDNAAGVLVEEMAPPGTEVITGGIIDPQFGPVVMFGLGGLFVEAIKDVVFALAPLDEKEAVRLIKRIKGYKVLAGFRGRPPADMKKLAGAVVLVSEIIGSGLVAEIDLNPLVVYPDGVLVVDAKLLPR